MDLEDEVCFASSNPIQESFPNQNVEVDELNLLLHEAIRNFNEEPSNEEASDSHNASEEPDGPFSLESFEAFSKNAREDISNAYGWLMAQLPFILLFMLLLVSDYLNVILVYTFNTFLLYAVSFQVKHQMVLKTDRNAGVLLLCLLGLGSQIFMTLKYYLDYDLGTKLFFYPYTGLWDSSSQFIFVTFWIVATNDLIVRIGTMGLKCLILIGLGANPKFIRRDQVYSIVDAICHVYRAVLPMPMWIAYLLSDSHAYFSSRLLILIYVFVKLAKLKRQFLKTVQLFNAHCAGHGRYGRYSTTAEVEKYNNKCTICRDAFSMPTTLSCKHVFCEDCISGWFVHEKTCPLCRTAILNAGTGIPSLFSFPSALGLRHHPVEIF